MDLQTIECNLVLNITIHPITQSHRMNDKANPSEGYEPSEG